MLQESAERLVAHDLREAESFQRRRRRQVAGTLKRGRS